VSGSGPGGDLKTLYPSGGALFAVAPLRLAALAIDPNDPRHMGRLSAAFIVLHLLVWTLLPGLSHRAPPWDNIEQLVWSQSLQWGYYKHPPAPTWWTFFWVQLLGPKVWVTFFAAQLSVAGMLWCLWRMALVVTTPLRAFVALVLTALVAYHGLRGIMANHNTLQLLPVALLLWSVLWAVRHQDRWRWLRWAAVGAAAALALLSKYSTLIWLAVIGAWLLQDARMRARRAWLPVGLAALVALAGVAPHIAWLARSDFAPLHYAEHSVEHGIGGHASRWVDLGFFVTAQLARVAPAVIALALLRRGLRRAPPAAPPVHGAERRFALFMGLGPLLLTAGLGVAGVHLAASWATTFYVFFGVLLLRWVPEADSVRLLRVTLIVGVAAELLLAGGLALGRGVLVDALGRTARSNFPAPALAQQIERDWNRYGHTPLRVVAGETWLAGNLSIHLPSRPRVFIDAEPSHAPWIRPDELARCDLLVVLDHSADAPVPDAALARLMARAQQRGELSVPWTSRPNGPLLTVDWGIVAATAPDCPAAR